MRCTIINRRVKGEKLKILNNKTRYHIKQKGIIKETCSRCGHQDSCDYCSSLKLLNLLDSHINYIKREINELEWDVDTWSYTILGNKKATEIDDEIVFIIGKYITKDEKEQYNYEYPENLERLFFERAFDEIVWYILQQNSRIAYQVLGWNILFYGAKMPEEIRELILLNSKWEDEQEHLEDDDDWVERRHWLSDFYEKIESYKEGNPVKVKLVTKNEIFKKASPDRDGFVIIDREPIHD